MGKLKFWYWVIGVGFALIATVYGLAQWRASQIFARHEADVKAKIAEIRARSHEREPLFDDPIPGNAWEIYRKVWEAFEAVPNTDCEAVMRLRDKYGGAPTMPRIEAIWERYAPQAAPLRQALRMKEVWPDYRYEDGINIGMPSTNPCLVAYMLCAGAAVLHARGEDAEAMELLVLAFGMGHDICRHGDCHLAEVNRTDERIGADGWREILSGHSLQAHDLERLAGLLDRLDRTRPDLRDAFIVEDLKSRISMITLDRTNYADKTFRHADPWSFARSWPYFFSRRLCTVAALDIFQDFYRDMEDTCRLPAHEREAAANKRLPKEKYAHNGWATIWLWSPGGSFRREALARMRWTLMRTATALAWYEAEKGAMPEKLEDLIPRYLPAVQACPFTGKPLGYTHGKVWSYGFDGKDDGGKPVKDDLADFDIGDIVWVVQRKK